MNDLFAELIRDAHPGTSYSSQEPALAKALVADIDSLNPTELAQVVHVMAEHRPFAVLRAFRTSELAAARSLLLAEWDSRDHPFWDFVFFREAIRRERAMAASKIWEDLSKSTNIPGLRKRLRAIVERHSADDELLAAMAVAIQDPPHSNSVRYPGGGAQRVALAAWLARDGSPRSIDAIRAYGEILSHTQFGPRHLLEIAREYGTTPAITALADELEAWVPRP